MRMSKANLKLNELLRETFSRICFWEAEAERAKRPESQYITTLGWIRNGDQTEFLYQSQ